MKIKVPQSKSIKPKVVVILGPTASGKTALGVKLAQIFNGEIISADSRQVYRGMDIGTGKDLSEYKIGRNNIPYHLIDIIQPNTKFNLARYQKLALKAINEVISRGKLPIVVGGTGLYLQAIADNYHLSEIKINSKKRLELEKKTRVQLLEELTALKPEFVAQLNNSDKNNPRRLIRYIEIISGSGEMVQRKGKSLFDFLILGIEISDEKMKSKIVSRLNNRLDREEMIAEVKSLKEAGVSFRRLISFGLEYKFISYFLQDKISREEMVEKLGNAIYRFAKKQKTWFRRWEKQGRVINWIADIDAATKKIKTFLKTSD
jgi:tRNA dimethylallyltransferase